MIFFAFGGITCCGSASLKLCVCNAAYPWSQCPSPHSQCTVSKVMASLLNGWIWPIGGASSGRVCVCSLRRRLVKVTFVITNHIKQIIIKLSVYQNKDVPLWKIYHCLECNKSNVHESKVILNITVAVYILSLKAPLIKVEHYCWGVF